MEIYSERDDGDDEWRRGRWRKWWWRKWCAEINLKLESGICEKNNHPDKVCICKSPWRNNIYMSKPVAATTKFLNIKTPLPPSMQSWTGYGTASGDAKMSCPTLHRRGKGASYRWIQKCKWVIRCAYALSGWLFFSQTPVPNFRVYSWTSTCMARAWWKFRHSILLWQPRAW